MSEHISNELKILRLYKKAFSMFLQNTPFSPRLYLNTENLTEWDELMEDK